MEKIVWDKKSAIGASEVDEWQEKTVDCVNNLFELVDNNAETKDLIDALIVVSETARYLFGAEDSLLQKYKYPDMKSHQKEHKVFIKNTALMRRMLSDDEIDISQIDFNSLGEWVILHIEESNQVFAPFIRIHMNLEKQRVASRRR